MKRVADFLDIKVNLRLGAERTHRSPSNIIIEGKSFSNLNFSHFAKLDGEKY